MARTSKTLAGDSLDPEGDGQPGGLFRLSFTTSGISALANTAVIGHVFASELGTAGANRPLQGAIVTVDGAEESLRAVTDATGSFKLQPAPPGRFFVHVDGRTAVGSQWPNGAYYPFVGKAWEAVPGKTNNLAGGSGEIFLPLIQADALKTVSATEETKITFVPSVLAANPALAGVEIIVPANSLFSDNGTRGGKVGIAPVPPDRLPEPLPPGLNFPLVITIQTDGGSNFDVPVPVKFPNLPDPITGVKLGPGAKTVLWSFNHDTGRWEIQGTMTITADGNFAVSDPGVGIRQPGWHGTAPGSSGRNRGSGTPPPAPPGKCDGDQELKMWFQIVDIGTDTALMPLDLAPPLGCATGFALSGLRSARDCALLDVDECPTSLRNNLINGGLGCIPIFGNLLGTTFSAAQTASEIDKYHDNCAGQAAALAQARFLQPATAVASSFLQDLEKARDLMFLQDEVNQALTDLNALLLGSPAWRPVEWRTPGHEYIRLLQVVRAAVSGSSPMAEVIAPEERTDILQLARPDGISLSDVEALIARFADTAPKGLQIPATPANLTVFDRAMDLLDQVYAQGWRSPHGGAIQSISILSRLLEPLPPGTSLAFEGSGSAQQVFPRGRHHYALVNLETGFISRGRLNAETQLENIILAPDSYYFISYLMAEPAAGLASASPNPPYYGIGMFKSNVAGVPTFIPYARMLEDNSADSDLDGLSDHGELVLGTNAYTPDADGDGIPDGQEVFSGSNPLDGVGLPLGVIAVSPTPGTARDVGAGNGLAVVASSGGLAIVDVSNPQNPVQVAVVSGDAKAVALRGSLALVAFSDGVRMLDLAAPAAPQTL